MKRIKACSFLFFLLFHSPFNYGGCLKKASLFVTQNPLKLSSSTLEHFKLLKQQTKHSQELNFLLSDLDSSIFLKYGNLVKFRSKKILMAISLLDQLGFKNDYFLSQILKGKKLTTNEVRAFYLLNKRRFWFEEDLYKNHLSKALSHLSLMDLIERSLTKQGNSLLIPQIDELIAQFNDKSFMQRLFGKETYEEHYHEQFRGFFKRSDLGSEMISVEISNTLQTLEKKMSDSTIIRKRYYQFRYDQLKIIQSVLNNPLLILKDYKVRYKFIFSQFPNNFKSIEGLARLMLILSASIIVLEYLLSEYVLKQGPQTVLGAHQFPEIILSHKEIYHISEAEIIEEKCNSGEILPRVCINLLAELKIQDK